MIYVQCSVIRRKIFNDITERNLLAVTVPRLGNKWSSLSVLRLLSLLPARSDLFGARWSIDAPTYADAICARWSVNAPTRSDTFLCPIGGGSARLLREKWISHVSMMQCWRKGFSQTKLVWPPRPTIGSFYEGKSESRAASSFCLSYAFAQLASEFEQNVDLSLRAAPEEKSFI